MFTNNDHEESVPEVPPTGEFSHDAMDGIVAGAAATWRRLFQTRVVPDQPDDELSDEAERRFILRDLDLKSH